MQFTSKLPKIETSIFAVMSALANECGAINLSQGFPNFEGDVRLRQLVAHYLNAGVMYNQYAPMAGVPLLTQRITDKIKRLYQMEYDAKTEVTITAGATEALSSALLALVQQGDEVILIEPAYDSYRPFVELAGGKAVVYAMKAPHWRIDWRELERLVTDKTRLILVNTPHNPTGAVFQESDWSELQRIVKDTNIFVLSDEVYEHLVFDGQPHRSVLQYPQLRERSLAVFSFGKTLHNTGWKIGYIVGDARLMAEVRKVHQYNVFSVNTPIQYAIADYIEDENTYLGLPAFFQEKRDKWMPQMPFDYIPTQGTYFQIADYSRFSDEGDVDFCKRVTREYGVALIPVSGFYSDRLDQKVVRICFAKTDETMQQAAVRLARLNAMHQD